MITKFTKATSKGQITIPMVWRKKFNTDNFIIESHKDYLLLKPILKEEIIFDADRDNGGKGVSPQEIIDMIRKIENE